MSQMSQAERREANPSATPPRPVLTWGAGLGGRPDVRRPCRLTPRCLPGVSQPHPPPTASGCRWEGGKNQRRRAGRDESGKSRSAAHAPAEPRTWRGRPMHPEGSPPRPWGALAGQGAALQPAVTPPAVGSPRPAPHAQGQPPHVASSTPFRVVAQDTAKPPLGGAPKTLAERPQWTVAGSVTAARKPPAVPSRRPERSSRRSGETHSASGASGRGRGHCLQHGPGHPFT